MNTIRWKVHVPVPPEKVFDALNTDQGRASFWAESAIERDGVIYFDFINNMSYQSRVLARARPERFSIDYFGAVATFTLEPDGAGGTDVTLTHDGVDADSWNEVHAGWLDVLFPLKAWLAHGVDLRTHDPQRLWDDGYVDQ